jgi:hypothetical protein
VAPPVLGSRNRLQPTRGASPHSRTSQGQVGGRLSPRSAGAAMLLNRCLRQPSESCKFDVGNGIGTGAPRPPDGNTQPDHHGMTSLNVFAPEANAASDERLLICQFCLPLTSNHTNPNSE